MAEEIKDYVSKDNLTRFWNNIKDFFGQPTDAQVDEWLSNHPEAFDTLGEEAINLTTNYVTKQTFNVSGNSESVELEIYGVKDVPLTIDVSTISTSGNITLYTTSHTSPSVRLNNVGTFSFTPSYSGYLRIYFSGTGSISGTIYSPTRFDNNISDIEDEITDIVDAVIPSDIVKATPSVQKLQIKSINVFDSVITHANKYLNANSNTTIANYQNYLADSNVQTVSEPIRIRDINGILIYNNLHWLNAATFTNRVCITFDKAGKYLRSKRGDALAQNGFLSDEYFAVLSEYSNFSDNKWIVDSVNIEWLNNSKNTYYVGTNGDWQTFTDMLVALENDSSEKTIYVEAGTYDIFTEMGGAAFIATIDDPENTNWRDVCHVVPPNTTIIGLGNVILAWEPDSTDIGSRDMAFLFSPLNLSGSCVIENITVKVKNGRYAIHDETSGLSEYDNSTRVLRNVKAIFESGSTYGYTYAYGAGHNKNMKFLFENCYFESQSGSSWSTHDWSSSGANGASQFTFNNCVFKVGNNKSNIRFVSSDSLGRLDQVHINSCDCSGVIYDTGSSGGVQQGYEIVSMCCNELIETIDENVTVSIPMKQYIVIPSIT